MVPRPLLFQAKDTERHSLTARDLCPLPSSSYTGTAHRCIIYFIGKSANTGEPSRSSCHVTFQLTMSVYTSAQCQVYVHSLVIGHRTKTLIEGHDDVVLMCRYSNESDVEPFFIPVTI